MVGTKANNEPIVKACHDFKWGPFTETTYLVETTLPCGMPVPPGTVVKESQDGWLRITYREDSKPYKLYPNGQLLLSLDYLKHARWCLAADSAEYKALSDMEKEFADMKRYVNSYGGTAYAGFYIDDEGVPRSLRDFDEGLKLPAYR